MLFALLAAVQVASQDPALVAKARAIHDRVIALDTHVDINPSNFTRDTNYTQRLRTQVDLVKMEEGGLDAVFLIVYVGQANDFTSAGYDRALASALAKFHAIHRLADTIASTRIAIAYTAADVRRIAASGRKVALIGIENGYPLGEDLANVKRSFMTSAGAICRWRTMGIHSCRIPTPESATACGSGMA
ncbi:MAG: membrane dipeptidase [Gemmatimonadaceae bacterium]